MFHSLPHNLHLIYPIFPACFLPLPFSPPAIFPLYCSPHFLVLFLRPEVCAMQQLFSLAFSVIQVYSFTGIHRQTNPYVWEDKTKELIASAFGAGDGDVCGDCHSSPKSGARELCPLCRQLLSHCKWCTAPEHWSYSFASSSQTSRYFRPLKASENVRPALEIGLIFYKKVV